MWRAPLSETALAGVAATVDLVIVADRELADTTDVFRALSASSGKEVWAYRYRAKGKLDYGNSPRATPLIHGDHVFCLGAFGHLSCLELRSGTLVWQKELKTGFGSTEDLPWGYCGSPLIADGRLIVAPGSKEASLVALEPASGKVLWQSPGGSPSYGSLVVATLGGKQQIVGHDETTLGGWDPVTGKRLWNLKPPEEDDFNVPTPLVHEGQLLVVTENNAARLFRFSDKGVPFAKPAAHFDGLAPDTHTPVIVGRRLFGALGDLYCLDLARGLSPVWKGEDAAFRQHTSLFASDARILVSSSDGELLLIDALADKFTLLGRQKVFEDDGGLLSHPALVGTRLYIRGSNEIVCVSLEE